MHPTHGRCHGVPPLWRSSRCRVCLIVPSTSGSVGGGFCLLISAIAIAGPSTAADPLQRPIDEVTVTGSEPPSFSGAALDRIHVYRWEATPGQFEAIPFQIVEQPTSHDTEATIAHRDATSTPWATVRPLVDTELRRPGHRRASRYDDWSWSSNERLRPLSRLRGRNLPSPRVDTGRVELH